MKSADKTPAQVSSGVEALIERLRAEGVAAGRREAEKIVADADRRAQWIIEQAHEEAEQIRQTARADAERYRKAGEEALHVAARDALLALKATLAERFAGEVRRLTAIELAKTDILQRMILEITGRAREAAQHARHLEILLPHDAVGLEELRRNPDALAEGVLTQFAVAVAKDMLCEGVSFGVRPDDSGGLQLRLIEDDIIIDLSEQTIAELLLEHLQPRFRALLEGFVG